MKIKKNFISLLLTISMMLLLLPMTIVSADSGFDLRRAKELYEQQIEKEKAENEHFSDAYMIDVYNNNEPILIVLYYDENDYYKYSYSYKVYNNQLQKEDDTNFLIYKVGSTLGGYNQLYKDSNNRIYIEHNGYYMREDETWYELYYFSGNEQHSMYSYHSSAMEEECILYDENGNAANVDWGCDNIAEQYFGLTPIFNGEDSEDIYLRLNKYGSEYGRYYDLISILLNGSAIYFDQQPIIESGRTLVPLRAIFESLGATVNWDESTQTVTATGKGKNITLQIGSNQMRVNNETKTLDVPAQIKGGRTLVPVRAISEAFGCNVTWDGDLRQVIITE